MKNIFKLVGIIALAAVIMLSMTACSDSDNWTPDLESTVWRTATMGAGETHIYNVDFSEDPLYYIYWRDYDNNPGGIGISWADVRVGVRPQGGSLPSTNINGMPMTDYTTRNTSESSNRATVTTNSRGRYQIVVESLYGSSGTYQIAYW